MRSIPKIFRLMIASVFVAAATVGAGLPDSDIQPAVSNNEPAVQVPGETTEWYYTEGVFRVTKNGSTFNWNVKVWSAPDGRYRVITTSLDGSGVSQEVAYDGHKNQHVVIASPGGHKDAFIVENDSHFAVTGMSLGSTTKYEGTVYENFLVNETSLTGSGGSASYTAGTITSHRGDPSVLTVEIPDGLEVRNLDEETRELEVLESDDSSDDTVVRSRVAMMAHAVSGYNQMAFSRNSGIFSTSSRLFSGSRTQTMLDLNSRPCLEAKNFRNSRENYFRASSRVISDPSIPSTCRWVGVSAWADGFFNGWCGFDWKGTSGTNLDFSRWAGYFEVSGKANYNDFACSIHWGQDEDWVWHIPRGYMSASIRG